MSFITDIGDAFEDSFEGQKDFWSDMFDPHTVPKTRSSITRHFNSMISQSLTRDLSTCCSDVRAEQRIQLTCRPAHTIGFPYEANTTCTACISNVFEQERQQFQVEQEMWSRGPATVKLPIATQFDRLHDRLRVCGRGACKACVFSDIHQNNIINVEQNCFARLENSSSYIAHFKNQLTKYLGGNPDVLGGIMQHLGSNSVDEITNLMSTQLRSRVVTDLIARFQSIIQSSQVLELSGVQTVRGITQNSATTLMNTLVEEAQISTHLFSEALFTAVEENIKLTQSLDSIGGTVFKIVSTVTGLLSSTLGKICTFLFLLVSTTMLCFVVAILYNKLTAHTKKKTNPTPTAPSHT